MTGVVGEIMDAIIRHPHINRVHVSKREYVLIGKELDALRRAPLSPRDTEILYSDIRIMGRPVTYNG